jgi:hypothetical protein
MSQDTEILIKYAASGSRALEDIKTDQAWSNLRLLQAMLPINNYLVHKKDSYGKVRIQLSLFGVMVLLPSHPWLREGLGLLPNEELRDHARNQ